MKATDVGSQPIAPAAGDIEVTAEQVTLLNHSSIDASVTNFNITPSAGHITFNVDVFSATDSAILATEQGSGGPATGGSVTIHGLQGSGTFARSVPSTNTEVSTSVVAYLRLRVPS